MKTKQSQRAEKRELDRKEWDFRSIPKFETEACYIYEYARELTRRSPRILKLFVPWQTGRRAGEGTPQFSKGGEAYKEFRKIMTACFPDFPLINGDWFPDTPWQGLDDEVRSRLVKEVNSGPEHRWNNSPIHKVSLETLKFKKPNAKMGSWEWKYVPKPFREEDISQTERGFFTINWAYSDTQLKRAFAKWLLEERKIKYKPAGPGRGGSWDRLNWLGALRQKEYYRTKKQLVDSADAQGDKLKIGASFYSQYRDLRDAAKKGRGLLNAFLSQVERI